MTLRNRNPGAILRTPPTLWPHLHRHGILDCCCASQLAASPSRRTKSTNQVDGQTDWVRDDLRIGGLGNAAGG